MERENTGQKEQAPPGTYDYLSRFRGRIYNHPTKPIGCSIQQEDFCKETRGSCMDLFISSGELGMTTEWHAHITDKNEIAELSGSARKTYTSEYDESFKPNIEDMISKVKYIRAQFDIDPYEKPLF